MKDQIFYKYGKMINLIVVNWQHRSLTLYAAKAAVAVRVIAAEMVQMLTQLANYRGPINFESFYLIGHSFGAQMLGMTGYRIYQRTSGRRFGQLIALDVADHCFHRDANYVIYNDTLSTYSALRVKVIHTNGDFAGTYKKYGHADIYISDGSTLPGCMFRTDAFHNWEFGNYTIAS